MSRGARSKFLRVLKIALVLLLVAFAWAAIELVRGPVEPVEEHRVFDEPVAPIASSEARPEEALRVSLTFEEGAFRITGGGTDGAVRIDAQYDSANYELETLLEDPEEGAPRYDVTLRRRISAIRSLLTTLKFDMVQNRVHVALPEGVPLDLTLDLSKGEHRVDLSGLSIVRLEVRARMGEAELVFDELNPVEMSELLVESKMGQFTARGLGYADARVIDARGSMGEQFLDFRGTPRGDTELELHMSMGSGHLDVPQGRPVELARQSSFLGEVHVMRRSQETGADPGLDPVPRLRLDLGVRMGEVIVR